MAELELLGHGAIEKAIPDTPFDDFSFGYGRLGVSTQEFGGICQWLINVLNIITGNFDKKGGVLFTLPLIDLVGMSKLTGKTGSFDRRRSRVSNLPEYSGEYPLNPSI